MGARPDQGFFRRWWNKRNKKKYRGRMINGRRQTAQEFSDELRGSPTRTRRRNTLRQAGGRVGVDRGYGQRHGYRSYKQRKSEDIERASYDHLRKKKK